MKFKRTLKNDKLAEQWRFIVTQKGKLRARKCSGVKILSKITKEIESIKISKIVLNFKWLGYSRRK